MNSPKQVPVVDGLFTLPPEGPNLIGTKCTSCGTYYLPKSLSCRNPNCEGKKTEDAKLSRRGRVHSYTIQYYPPPPPFKMEPFEPYGIGLVELPEGIRIMGMLTGCALENIRIGMDVELVTEKLYENDQGDEVVTYKFKPVDS